MVADGGPAEPARVLSDDAVTPRPWVSTEDGIVYMQIPALGQPVTMGDTLALIDALVRAVAGFHDAPGLVTA